LLKWACVYLNLVRDGQHLYQQLQAYFAYYPPRPHQALKGQTPASIYAQMHTFNPEPSYLTIAS
jgi:putative transposase